MKIRMYKCAFKPCRDTFSRQAILKIPKLKNINEVSYKLNVKMLGDALSFLFLSLFIIRWPSPLYIRKFVNDPHCVPCVYYFCLLLLLFFTCTVTLFSWP